MNTAQHINAAILCRLHGVEISFVQQLQESGIIILTRDGGDYFIDEEQLPLFEKYANLHYELEVNYPGLEVIHQLLENQQQQLHRLKELQNKINFLERVGVL